MTNEALKNTLSIIDTLLDDAITDSTRQKVKDNLTEVCQLAMKALDQRWIPVSERLPEVGKKVLCQCQANIYEVLKLTVDGWYHDENHCYMLGFVIAWMSLPEPYKEGETDDE